MPSAFGGRKRNHMASDRSSSALHNGCDECPKHTEAFLKPMEAMKELPPVAIAVQGTGFPAHSTNSWRRHASWGHVPEEPTWGV